MLIRKGEVKGSKGLLTPALGSEKHSVTDPQHTDRVGACGPSATPTASDWLMDCLLLVCLMCLYCHQMQRVPPVNAPQLPCPISASRYHKD